MRRCPLLTHSRDVAWPGRVAMHHERRPRSTAAGVVSSREGLPHDRAVFPRADGTARPVPVPSDRGSAGDRLICPTRAATAPDASLVRESAAIPEVTGSPVGGLKTTCGMRIASTTHGTTAMPRPRETWVSTAARLPGEARMCGENIPRRVTSCVPDVCPGTMSVLARRRPRPSIPLAGPAPTRGLRMIGRKRQTEIPEVVDHKPGQSRPTLYEFRTWAPGGGQTSQFARKRTFRAFGSGRKAKAQNVRKTTALPTRKAASGKVRDGCCA